MNEEVNINLIIEDEKLKPYFLDLVGKNFLKNLNQSHSQRYLAKLKAQKDFYDSLYNLSEKLRYVVPDQFIQPTITEVLNHYMQSLRPIMRKENFDTL